MKNILYKFLKKLFTAEQGLAAVEFALALPLLIVITFGSIEVVRYVIIVQKIEKVSLTLSDLVAQSETITTADLNQIIVAAKEVMSPYNFDTDGYAIISSVTKTGIYPPVVNWQYKSSGTTRTSAIGSSGSNATIPSGFTMIDGDTVIITEVFFNYTPMLSGIIYNSSQIYNYSIYKPRLGNLKTLGLIFQNTQTGRLICLS